MFDSERQKVLSRIDYNLLPMHYNSVSLIDTTRNHNDDLHRDIMMSLCHQCLPSARLRLIYTAA